MRIECSRIVVVTSCVTARRFISDRELRRANFLTPSRYGRSLIRRVRVTNVRPGEEDGGNKRGGRFMDHPILASIRLPTQDSRG